MKFARAVAIWRLVLAAPLPWAAAVACVLFAVAVVELATVLRRAEVVRQAEWVERCRVAADVAAMDFDRGTGGERVLAGGVRVTVHRRARDLRIESRCPDGRSFAFVGTELDGAAPFALALDCAATDPAVLEFAGVGRRIDVADLPRLDSVTLAAAPRADRLPYFRLDKGVAMLHLRAGTEADDFVFAASAQGPIEVPGDLVVVPGHLWVEPGPTPLRLRLPRDLVVVAHGNLYLGRSVAVEGPGRLCLVTAVPQGAVSFADRDGDGRWSAGDQAWTEQGFRGPFEGAGGVYLGLSTTRHAVQVDAAVVVEGELHLRVDATVRGPLVAARGVTRFDPGARLVAAGEWAFHAERERVPGFVTSGGRRLGRLTLLARNPRAAHHEALYLPAPAR